MQFGIAGENDLSVWVRKLLVARAASSDRSAEEDLVAGAADDLEPGLGGEQVDGELLESIWRNLGRLHATGVAHRRLDASRILIRLPTRRGSR